MRINIGPALLGVGLLLACQVGTQGQGVCLAWSRSSSRSARICRAMAPTTWRAGSGRVVDYLRYTPGGGVFVLTPPTPDGAQRELTAAFKGVDIAGQDLAFDAKSVVFSMRHKEMRPLHLYVANTDGSGKVNHSCTFGMPTTCGRSSCCDRIALLRTELHAARTRATNTTTAREVTQIGSILFLPVSDRRLWRQNLSHVGRTPSCSTTAPSAIPLEHLGTHQRRASLSD